MADRRRRRSVARLALLVVGFQVVAFAAVAVAELVVPDRLIVDELREGFDEGTLTRSLVMSQRTGGLTDHYGECVLLTIGLGAPPDMNLLERAALSPNLHHCVDTMDRLEFAAAGGELRGTTKVRYWNGTSVISRPVFATVGINGLRTLSTLAFVAATVFLLATIDRVGGRLAAVGFGVPLLTADLVGLVEVFHHPLMLAAGFAGAAVIARSVASGAERERIAAVALLAGATYSFLDLMNYVAGLLAVVTVLAAVAAPAASWRDRASTSAVVGTAWAGGYLVTWIGAWVVAGLASSPSAVLDEIRDQFAFRVNGETEGITTRSGAGLEAAVEHWLDPALSRLVVAGTIVVLAAASIRVLGRAGPGLLVLALPVVAPVLFFLVTNNHTQIHFWFEYRSLAMALGSLAMLWGAAWSGRFDPPATTPPTQGVVDLTLGEITPQGR
ncbi:MAG: hypothetical protein AAGF02_04255 [Actinomycetota bacterium]